MSRLFIAGLVAASGSSATLAQNAAFERDRAYAAQVLADAASRASYADDVGTSGFRNGRFFISDNAGDNSLGFSGSLQARYNASFRSNDPPLGDHQDFTSGFSLGTARLRANGSVWSRDFSYAVSASFANDGTFLLEDAFACYSWETGWSLTAGQFRVPLLREESVPEENQLAVERSQTNERFNQDWSQGVLLAYRAQQARLFASFTDGFASPHRATSANTPFDSPAEADYALSFRAEWMWAGADWSRFDRFSSWRSNSTYAGMAGAAIAYQHFGNTGATAPSPSGSDYTYTIDLSVQGRGWNAFAAFIGNHDDTEGLPATDDLGFVVQGGYFVHDQVEVFARWDAIFLDDNSVLAPNADTAFNFITVGANYFPFPDSDVARISADLVFALDETTGLVNPLSGDSRTGLLGDPSSGEVDLRIQFQLKF